VTEQQGQIVIELLTLLTQPKRGPLARRDSITLDTAITIEDLFAQHHVGGRTQRLAKIQVAVKLAIEKSLGSASA
jgi:hypothetical protein